MSSESNSISIYQSNTNDLLTQYFSQTYNSIKFIQLELLVKN